MKDHYYIGHIDLLETAAAKAAARRFAADPVILTGFDDLRAEIINAASDLRAQEQADWDEIQREKRDAEIARYGWRNVP